MELEGILKKHELWLAGDKAGKHADLRGANLVGTDLSGAKLSLADLRGANLKYTDLGGVKLGYADLRHANLYGADLRNADLHYANLSNTDLSGTDLRGANLKYTNLSTADLSGSKGLLSAIDYLADNFEHTDDGYIVYKCFNGSYIPPSTWSLKPGSVIEEEVNPNRTDVCGCGINVATLSWVRNKYPNRRVYKLLIRWAWLPGVVVPYNTDGKIRCARAEIIERVESN